MICTYIYVGGVGGLLQDIFGADFGAKKLGQKNRDQNQGRMEKKENVSSDHQPVLNIHLWHIYSLLTMASRSLLDFSFAAGNVILDSKID